VITVTVRYTRAAQADPALLEQLRQPMALGLALARQVKERVSQRGDTATAVERYQDEVRLAGSLKRLSRSYDRTEARLAAAVSQRNERRASELRAKLRQIENSEQSLGDKVRAYKISEAYAQALGLHETTYRSSAAFHEAAGTKPGSFRVTGGMWQGLQVRNVGAGSVVLDFEGSSTGAARQSSTTKTGRQRSRPVRVRNQVKAGTVYRFSKVNVVQPKDTENEAMAAAVCRWSQNMLVRTLGATAGEFGTTGDQQLLQAILRQYDGKR